jgi:hypothetical protein
MTVGITLRVLNKSKEINQNNLSRRENVNAQGVQLNDIPGS